MNRIEKRPIEVTFDKDAVREAYLAGSMTDEIALRFGGFNHEAVRNYIYQNSVRWRTEARYSTIVSDDRRTVIPIFVETDRGPGFLMPVSVARNTMHLLALRGEAHHAN